MKTCFMSHIVRDHSSRVDASFKISVLSDVCELDDKKPAEISLCSPAVSHNNRKCTNSRYTLVCEEGQASCFILLPVFMLSCS